MTTETSNARGNLLRPKLENIISGHRINADDADWLRGLLVAAPPTAARGDVRGLVDALVDAAYQDGTQELDAMSNETLSARSALEHALAAEGVQNGYDTPPDWYARREQHAREMGYAGLADALDDLERRRGEGVQAGAEYADAEALIAHLESLCDESDEKWQPAQAAIAGILSWQTTGSPVASLSQQPEARGVVDEAMARRFTDALPALYAHDAPPISAVMLGLTAALTGERNG